MLTKEKILFNDTLNTLFLQYLPLISVLRMMEVNRALKATVSHSDGFWRYRYITHDYDSFKETWREKSEYNKKAKGIQKELLYIVLKNAQPNQKTISRAAYLGNLSIIQWICTHAICTPSEWALHNAAYSGNLSLVKWLHKKHHIIPNVSTMHYACYTANPDVIQWLFDETKIAPDMTALKIASKCGNEDIVKWICSNHPITPDEETLEEARRSGNELLVEWLESLVDDDQLEIRNTIG